jgi:toxin ParE1/3/4
MSWNVVYSVKARQDLRNIYEYIAYKLLVPKTSGEQTQRIMKAIRTLDEMPMRHQLCKNEPWISQGVRYLPVDNYLVFYLPDESKNTVNVIRIMYSGRDVCEQLSETDM